MVLRIVLVALLVASLTIACRDKIQQPIGPVGSDVSSVIQTPTPSK